MSMKEKAYLVCSLSEDLDNLEDNATEKLWVNVFSLYLSSGSCFGGLLFALVARRFEVASGLL